MVKISRNRERKIKAGVRSYQEKIAKFDKMYGGTIEEIRRKLLREELSQEEKRKLEQVLVLKLRTTLFREIAVHYILPEILYILRIPKEKIGKVKLELRKMLNGISDAYQGYKEVTLKTKDRKKITEELEFKEKIINSSIKETEEELEKIGLKINLGFVRELCEKRLKEADEYIDKRFQNQEH
ncbi:MAG: hypothetical protein QXD98_03905 [Candidatus Diapherotrites archaeon]